MRQVLLSAPGLSDPGGIGNKWTNDGYQEAGGPEQNLKIITKKYEKGKRVI